MATSLMMTSTIAARRVAIAFYGLLLVASLVGMTSALAPTVPVATWLRVDGIVHTFIPMLIFLATVFWRQLKSDFSWSLLVQVFLTGGFLFGSALNHAFPERAFWFALPHLVLALIFAGFNLARSSRSGSY